MHYCKRHRVITLTYFCLISLFIGAFIFVSTKSSIEKPSEKEPVSSAVTVKPPLLSMGRIPESSDTECQPLRFLPHAELRPLTALASFPGSGNTWLRYLIQQATGIHTGSQYLDERLQRKGFPGESVSDASVAVVKTHECGPEIRETFQKAVLLIRHPRPAIQSFYNLWRGGGHVGIAPKRSYEKGNGKEWNRFFNWYIDDWQKTNLDWIQNFTGPLHIVLYDQLRDDLGPTLRSLVQFLDLPLDEVNIQCAVEHSEGLHHRKAPKDSFDPFTEEMKTRLNEAKENVLKKLKNYLDTKPESSNVSLYRFIEAFGLKINDV